MSRPWASRGPFWICQQIHHRAARSVGLSEDTRLRDRHAWQTGESLYHSEYVDKFVAFSNSESKTRDAVSSIVDRLTSLNLPVHEIEHCCTFYNFLGWEVDGKSGTVRPTSRRLWKVRLAIRHLLKVGRASGHDLERLIGHATFLSLIQRPGLSVFGQVYAFMRRHHSSSTWLWPGVRRELE